MGRAKLNMELIKKDKTRRVTYKKRKEGFIRKMNEFTTLCGVDACAVIYANSSYDTPAAEPDEVWPKNNDMQVRRLIDMYESKGKNSYGNKSYGLVDYFDEKNKKMEAELHKLRIKNGGGGGGGGEGSSSHNKYPTWFNFMDHLPEMELREFGVSLDEKIELVKNRLDLMKGNNFIELGQQQQHQQFMFQQSSQNIQQPQFTGLILNGVELKLMNQQQMNSVEAIPRQMQMMHYPSVYNVAQQEHHHNHSIINNNNNPNSMMMMSPLLNESVSDDALQNGNGTSNYNLRYEPSGSYSRVVENMVYNIPRPLSTSYYYPMQTVPPQMQYPVLLPGVPPELVTLQENGDVNDMHQAQMMGISPWFFGSS